MIQIEAIHIEEFRGIRNLNLTLDGKSFVVWGPNGSGKSGVVDAIDFGLTGDIARLGGPGNGNLTVQRHGPHVHRRDDPAASTVSLTVRETTTGKSAVLTRSVKSAKMYKLSPDVPEVRAAIDKAQLHPELTLSRREIIKYIVAEPSTRSVQVQALLKLDRLGSIRGLLKTVQTKTSSSERTAQTEVDAAEEGLRRNLDLTALLTTEVSAEINKRRAVLGLAMLEAVDQDTDLAAGVDTDSSERSFHKASAVRDVEALIACINYPAELTTAAGKLAQALGELDEHSDILASLQLRSFVETGLGLVTTAECPLCDTTWDDIDALRAHLADKIARSEAAAKLQARVLSAAQGVNIELGKVRELARVSGAYTTLAAADLTQRLQLWTEGLATLAGQLATIEGALNNRERLADPLAIPKQLYSDLDALLALITAKPDQTATAYARTSLTIAQERWTRLRGARASYEKANAAHKAGETIYSSYCKASDEALVELYHTVESEFSSYYSKINANDESAFKANLAPSAGKLDLNVSFYDLGMYPPGAYHSEGHQDGKGVCLYLALVKQILGDDFRFAVLDDVVMSVDSEHRREFCKLLKDNFPNVQFVITTHDETWARQMQATGLIGKSSQARFHSWTVNDGPAYEAGTDYWDKIAADLVRSDVPAAAACLRRNLESIMTDLATSLRAQVAFRPEGNYELGELLSAVKGRHSKLLNKATTSAVAWKKANDVVDRIDALKQARADAVLVQQDENWAVNAAVHFNNWANLSKADFAPVVEAWKQFLDLFTCGNAACGSWIYVSGSAGNEESLRCSCGDYDLNLRAK